VLRAERGSRGGWGGGPVRKEELLSPQLEAGIRWDNPCDRGQVVCQVEGDGRQRRDVMYEGGGGVSQSCDGVVSVPRSLDHVRRRTPVEVEEEIRLRGNFPACY